MSVHKNRVGGWDVRYRLEGRHCSRSFPKKKDALAFDKVMAEIREQARVKAAVESARKAAGV